MEFQNISCINNTPTETKVEFIVKHMMNSDGIAPDISWKCTYQASKDRNLGRIAIECSLFWIGKPCHYKTHVHMILMDILHEWFSIVIEITRSKLNYGGKIVRETDHSIIHSMEQIYVLIVSSMDMSRVCTSTRIHDSHEILLPIVLRTRWGVLQSGPTSQRKLKIHGGGQINTANSMLSSRGGQPQHCN